MEHSQTLDSEINYIQMIDTAPHAPPVNTPRAELFARKKSRPIVSFKKRLGRGKNERKLFPSHCHRVRVWQG